MLDNKAHICHNGRVLSGRQVELLKIDGHKVYVQYYIPKFHIGMAHSYNNIYISYYNCLVALGPCGHTRGVTYHSHVFDTRLFSSVMPNSAIFRSVLDSGFKNAAIAFSMPLFTL